jgi:hypothetical protein
MRESPREHYALWKETQMGHAVHIRGKEQYIEALRVLDKLPGTWRSIGTSDAPVFLLTDAQYKALVEAGVVNDKEVNARGKKTPGKKTKS